MKIIIVKSNKNGSQKCLVDDEDYDELIKYNWYCHKFRNTLYAERCPTLPKEDKAKGLKRKSILMHRFIMGQVNKTSIIDHIDHNGLNNQKSNLRLCTPSENAKNRSSRKNSTSKYLGVSYREGGFRKYKKKNGEETMHKIKPYWYVTICDGTKDIYVGRFETEDEAGLAYDKMATRVHGEFANLNFK